MDDFVSQGTPKPCTPIRREPPPDLAPRVRPVAELHHTDEVLPLRPTMEHGRAWLVVAVAIQEWTENGPSQNKRLRSAEPFSLTTL